MTFARQVFVVFVLALLTTLAAFASEKNQHKVNIADPVQVGRTHLKAGDYKLEWQGNGLAVEVSFLQDGKTMATVPATLKMNDSNVIEDDIVTKRTSANMNRLVEIDFRHQKEALMFEQNTSPTKTQSHQ